jgi:hypothetical protein
MLQANALWDGIVKAFNFVGPVQQLPVDAFAEAFRLLSGSVKEADIKAARQLIKNLMSAVEKYLADSAEVVDAEQVREKDIQTQNTFLSYIVRVCANLPFYTLDGPHYVMSTINQLVSSMGGKCLDEFKRVAMGEAAVDDVRLPLLCREGHCMGLLLGLSVHVQKAYNLKADRIRKWDSASLDKNEVPGKDVRERADIPELFRNSSEFKSDAEKLFKLLNSSMCTEAVSSGHLAEADGKQPGAIDWDQVLDVKQGTSTSKSSGRKRTVEKTSGGPSKTKKTKTGIESGSGKKAPRIKEGDEDDDFSPGSKIEAKSGQRKNEQASSRPARSSKNKRKLIDDDEDEDGN